MLGLSTPSHVLAHQALGSGSFDYGHCKRATGSSPGHAGRGCCFALPASGEGSGHRSLSLLTRQPLPPVSLCSHSCSDPTFGSPKPLLASASPAGQGLGPPPLATLDGSGRHTWPQMPPTQLGEGRGARRSGCDLPGPSVKLTLLWLPWVSATPIPPSLLTNSLDLTWKQKNFHSAGAWGWGWPLPVSDALCYWKAARSGRSEPGMAAA